ncbi:hydrolase or metal-binding protein, partial [Thalassospira xiamenensis]
ACELESQRQTAGFDQTALDKAAQRGFDNGAFEDSEEDVRAIAEEFYPIEENQAPAVLPQRTSKISLAEKLDVQAEAQ